MIRIVSSAFAATLLTLSLGAGAALAQTRVFVAAQGSDSNPCTFAAPCRTFQRAHDVVVAGGEINVLDPAGYGALNIGKSISIRGHGWASMSASGNGNIITINAGSTDEVVLSGLNLEGFAAGHDGIQFNSGGSLVVEDCVIQHVLVYAVRFRPAGSATLSISNTRLHGFVSGVDVEPTAGTVLSGSFERVVFNSTQIGAGFRGANNATVNFTLNDCAITNNSVVGLLIVGATIPSSSNVLNVTLNHSSITGNRTGISSFNGGLVQVTRSIISGNSTAFNLDVSGGNVATYGDNVMDGNGSLGLLMPLVTGTLK